MESLQDKIDAIKSLITENEHNIELVKKQAETDIAEYKVFNKEYAKSLKKLEKIDAQIKSIFTQE